MAVSDIKKLIIAEKIRNAPPGIRYNEDPESSYYGRAWCLPVRMTGVADWEQKAQARRRREEDEAAKRRGALPPSSPVAPSVNPLVYTPDGRPNLGPMPRRIVRG